MNQQKPATEIMLGDKGYKQSLLYWGVVVAVVAVFLVTTISYWLGTMKVLDENVAAPFEIKKAQK